MVRIAVKKLIAIIVLLCGLALTFLGKDHIVGILMIAAMTYFFAKNGRTLPKENHP